MSDLPKTDSIDGALQWFAVVRESMMGQATSGAAPGIRAVDTVVAEITRLRTELAEAQAQLSANEDGYVAHLKAELAEARKDAGRLRAELLDRAIYASMVDDPNQRVIGCDLCGAVACATSGYAVPHNNGCLAIDTAMANGAQEGTKG